jgi:hypothetical protein
MSSSTSASALCVFHSNTFFVMPLFPEEDRRRDARLQLVGFGQNWW